MCLCLCLRGGVDGEEPLCLDLGEEGDRELRRFTRCGEGEPPLRLILGDDGEETLCFRRGGEGGDEPLCLIRGDEGDCPRDFLQCGDLERREDLRLTGLLLRDLFKVKILTISHSNINGNHNISIR